MQNITQKNLSNQNQITKIKEKIYINYKHYTKKQTTSKQKIVTKINNKTTNKKITTTKYKNKLNIIIPKTTKAKKIVTIHIQKQIVIWM